MMGHIPVVNTWVNSCRRDGTEKDVLIIRRNQNILCKFARRACASPRLRTRIAGSYLLLRDFRD